MKKGNKLVIYLFVVAFVFAICFGFGRIFAFNEGKVQEDVPEVTEDLVEKLYNYLPKDNDYNVGSLYTTYYTTVQNLNYSVMAKMAYENIVNNDSFKLESLTQEELNSLGIKGTPVYKIKRDVFLDSSKTVFGSGVKEHTNDFNINGTETGTFRNDYVYIYSHANDNLKKDFVIFKDKLSYTVTDNNKTIKIYDYYLKCYMANNLCYNDEKDANLNNVIKYSSNLNIESYKDNLKQYVHIFKYEDGKYYWFSSESA